MFGKFAFVQILEETLIAAKSVGVQPTVQQP